MAARSTRRSKKSPRWLYALIGLVVIVVVMLMMAPMLVMSWVRGYLQKEAFRGKMEQFLGTQMKGSAPSTTTVRAA